MILLLPICGRCFIEIIWMLSSCDNDALKVVRETQLNFPSEIRICIVKGKQFEVVFFFLWAIL